MSHRVFQKKQFPVEEIFGQMQKVHTDGIKYVKKCPIDVSGASVVGGSHWRATVGTFALRKCRSLGRTYENRSAFVFLIPWGKKKIHFPTVHF